MMVIDASAALELLLATPVGLPLQDRILAERRTLHAPHLIDVEVAHVLRRFVQAGEIDAVRAEMALQDLADLRLQRYPHSPLLNLVWALRENLTGYDAVYVALAEILDAPLVTRDQRLASSPAHHARVEVV